MSFRRKLLLLFFLTVFLSVATVTAIVSSVTRRAFQKSDEERTAALVAQFRREFNRRGDEVTREVSAISSSEAVTRIGLALNQGSPDYSAFLNVAKNIATDQQLDFLEFLDGGGTILSSAQWPARFGYKENGFVPGAPQGAFLRQEQLPNGPALGLVAIREVSVGDRSLYVMGGRRLDKTFVLSLDLPAGSRAMLFESLDGGLPSLSSDPTRSGLLAPLLHRVQQTHQDAGAIIQWTSDARDSESVRAIPLFGQDNRLLAILLVANSRRSYIDLQRHFLSAAVMAAAAGILLAVLLSAWISRRVTRPVEQLADAAREVAHGNWYAPVPVKSSDDLGQLAEAFNYMTGELTEQRRRLIQSERVAAWRELARRLAHELKNPLFPLQLTVENLMRARQNSPEQFEEVFHESASTMLAEIANLKTIISRFSEFSRMPQPQFQSTDLNHIVRNVARLFQAQMGVGNKMAIECTLELGEPLDAVVADPELLHRALSNLVSNAIDAMPQGGVLTLRTTQNDNTATIEVGDTGAGIAPDERERLFTPYYTNKPHGTGLGLAIVQSVVSDHGGTISVRSEPGRGTRFVIELPRKPNPLAPAVHDSVFRLGS